MFILSNSNKQVRFFLFLSLTPATTLRFRPFATIPCDILAICMVEYVCLCEFEQVQIYEARMQDIDSGTYVDIYHT